MKQTTISIRIDDELKKEMEETCRELGLNITTAFTIFAKKMSREHRIPFEVSIDPFYSVNNLKAIDESIEQIKQGKVISKTMEELEAMENE
ncbi:MAG: type II toxin-antitoxin system antitoxin, RelB/DinJ family [Firmicutes bacterium HGW-Firmicutes-2]|jgi:DNA-damage-inducible protein J|uniref:Type II toxin-antitoxin system antitoxin, RelB/DinJ family n=1 Tax=Petrocella atlantisensis TaxID=2173034 RepID=A0A3P7PXS1_9FIRM|nr:MULTISPECIES: type II toxin-antitoxin system RelB/DinJ family antitoxin [Petrocella]MCF8020811.1 type II toxin-antitoxin system RelB/DinJ family antitoxin [Vallitaleaceae bacterium]MDF1618857.1 type II toxin-antitoxin system RelB/DinJ family antitoxin [Petrocella sp. FN5]PKM65160.1 MAG: type II toxin-antitoxin system antitoxin, RelB/DinJ family [Firmicutes bacterium HGW-Firmicutes-2]VDN47981.1 Type II toxin-antitoxin system antitoxin, RelB/DinJ family [Petrocella atlantisensis]